MTGSPWKQVHCLGWCPITTNHRASKHRVSQAILLDCRNFDPDAKKGTSRDVEAGCVLAKFEKGQRKHHNIYNNIENDRNELHLSQKRCCVLGVGTTFWLFLGVLRWKKRNFTSTRHQFPRPSSIGLGAPKKHFGCASEGWQELV